MREDGAYLLVSALKPRGALLVVEHSAMACTGNAYAQTLHRIDEQFTTADFAKHGRMPKIFQQHAAPCR